MRQQPNQPVHQVLILGLLLAALATLAPPARAYHTESQRLVDWTAYTLERNEWRVGILDAEYGIVDQLMVGTYLAPWVLFAATGKTVVNGYIKGRPLTVGPFTASLRANVFYVNAEDIHIPEIIENGNVDGTFLPLSVAASYAFNNDWGLSLEGTYVKIFADAADNTVDANFSGSGAHDNVQIAGQLEWRLTRVTALTLRGRWVPWASPTAIETEATLEAGGRVTVEAAATTPIDNAWQVVPGVAFSWEVLNLHLGMGYGNIFLPGVGLVTGFKYPVPEFNLYFRF